MQDFRKDTRSELRDGVGVAIKRGAEGPCGDGAVLTMDCAGARRNPRVMAAYRTKHTHTAHTAQGKRDMNRTGRGRGPRGRDGTCRSVRRDRRGGPGEVYVRAPVLCISYNSMSIYNYL